MPRQNPLIFILIVLICPIAQAADIFRPDGDEAKCEAKLTLLDAVLNPSTFARQVRSAVTSVQGRSLSPWEKTNALEDEFTRIARASYGQWQFRRIKGSDGSTLFMGPDGPSIVIDPHGRIFKGLVDIEFFGRQVWLADYSFLQEIPAPKVPQQ